MANKTVFRRYEGNPIITSENLVTVHELKERKTATNARINTIEIDKVFSNAIVI